MSEQLSIMQVILNLELAGAQEVVYTLAQQFQQTGHTVIVCGFEDGPMRTKLQELGIPVYVIQRPAHDMLNLPLFLQDLWKIRTQLQALVQTHHINVIQTHILQVLDFVVLSLRTKTGRPVVFWTIQNIEFLPITPPRLLQFKRLLYRALYRLFANRVNGFVAVSVQVKEAIMSQLGAIAHKIYTIPNSVDVSRYTMPGNKPALCAELNLNPNSRLVAVVGRLTRQKGHCYLIEAIPAIIAVYPDAHFLLIGQGELKDSLLAQTQSRGVINNVHFLGSRRDIPALLAASDLFVLPSLWEGLSVALLEAMAAAKPVVATAVSGTTQVLTHQQTGLIIPPADTPALAQAVLWMINNPDQAQEMAQAARKHVTANFSAQKQAADHLALFNHHLALTKQ